MKACVMAAVLLALAACNNKPASQDQGEDAARPAETAAPAKVPAAPADATWPKSLHVVGDGFPNKGDPCRVIGESDATRNYLGDGATLAGCPSVADAAKLSGEVVATIEGVTLVSVPEVGY